MLASTSRLPEDASRSKDRSPDTAKASPIRACRPVTRSTGSDKALMALRV